MIDRVSRRKVQNLQIHFKHTNYYFVSNTKRDALPIDLFTLGTCYYPVATDYYTNAENLFNNLRIPDYSLLNTGTATIIRNAFLTLNTPKLFSSAIRVEMNAKGLLKEVKLCYNLQYQFATCA